MVDVISAEDLRLYLQVDTLDDAQATAYVAIGMAMVEAYLRCQVTPRQDVYTVRPRWDGPSAAATIVLPLWPVMSVDRVEACGMDGVWVDITANTESSLTSGILSVWGPVVWGTPLLPVYGTEAWRVTYTAGMAEVPGPVKSAALLLAGEAFASPAGVDSETVGGYSVKYGGARGAATLPAAVRMLLDPYRRPVLA